MAAADLVIRISHLRGRGVFLALLLFAVLNGCQSGESLTRKEMAVQAAADSEVASTLFERGLDEEASYNVRKDGCVVSRFDKSVLTSEYTLLVDALRRNPRIKGVHAEQGGNEVCILKQAR